MYIYIYIHTYIYIYIHATLVMSDEGCIIYIPARGVRTKSEPHL